MKNVLMLSAFTISMSITGHIHGMHNSGSHNSNSQSTSPSNQQEIHINFPDAETLHQMFTEHCLTDFNDKIAFINEIAGCRLSIQGIIALRDVSLLSYKKKIVQDEEMLDEHMYRTKQILNIILKEIMEQYPGAKEAFNYLTMLLEEHSGQDSSSDEGSYSLIGSHEELSQNIF